MRCRRCKRTLANPRSIKRRFGPRCWAHELEEFAAAAQGDLFEGWQGLAGLPEAAHQAWKYSQP
jgi:hypothetical protein